MHEMGIEQTRRTGHSQDEAVGLDNLVVDAVLIVAVAGICRQVFEGIMVVDKRHGIAPETIVPDQTVILEQAETVSVQVIKRLPDLFLQGEVKGRTLEASLVIDTLDPVLDVGGSTPELTD